MTKQTELHNFAARCDGYAATCSDPADAERWAPGITLPRAAGGNVYPGIVQLG